MMRVRANQLLVVLGIPLGLIGVDGRPQAGPVPVNELADDLDLDLPRIGCHVPVKRRFKADRLQEQLKDALLILGIVRERLSPGERGEMLEHLRAGRMDLDDFAGGDMRAYAKWYLRVQRLRQSIGELRGFRRRPRQQPAAVETG